MVYRHVRGLLHGAKHLRTKQNCLLHSNTMLYHSFDEPHGDLLPSDCYKVIAKMTKLGNILKHIDTVDGRLVNVNDNFIVDDDVIEQKMRMFKSLTTAYIGSSSLQQSLQGNAVAISAFTGEAPFVCYREPLTVNCLTKVWSFLNMSSQQRKEVRFKICPQVTHHKVWIGAIEEILNGLKAELGSLNPQVPSWEIEMGKQIVSCCLKLLSDISYDPDATSWMKIAPSKIAHHPCGKWKDILDMCNDLIKCLRNEERLRFHVSKLTGMREGLSQIKEVSIDKSIGFKEVRHQESLVQKKLSKTLGHSSQCLFTLLMYYLYGHVGDIELDICGGNCSGSRDGFAFCVGKVLTSGEERMVRSGLKQLDRAVGLLRFVWEVAGIKGGLELQGHLWCVGAEERTVTYRGNTFFVHGISV